MQQLRKMGSLTKIMGMLPGMGQFRDQLADFDEREIDRVQAIIRSMTRQERHDPKIINGSRRARIAKGSGVHVSEVNGLVDRFFEARKMMQSIARGGGMPGMGGVPGAGKRAKQNKQKQKGKGKSRSKVSGNPAKRAQQEREAAERAAAGSGQEEANPFGLPAGQEDFDPADLQLPPEVAKFLKQ
jgi:signal recognition particle subunit SRP54